MKTMLFVKRENEIILSLTFIGCLIKKILRNISTVEFPYSGRMVYEHQVSQYRPTIPGLFFHLFKFIFSSKKSLHSCN